MGFGFGCGCDCGKSGGDATLNVRVDGCNPACGGLPGALVTLSGDVSASATTSASGIANFPGLNSGDSVVVSVASPPGAGFAPGGLAAFTLAPGVNSRTVQLGPDVEHVCFLGKYPLPRELEYSDDYGSCTISYTGPSGASISYSGSYIYNSSNASGSGTILCSGFSFCAAPPTSGDVEVWVGATPSVSGTCSQYSWAIERWGFYANLHGDCVTDPQTAQWNIASGTVCQNGAWVARGAASGPQTGPGVPVSLSSVSLAKTNPFFAVPEVDATADITE